MQIPMGRNAPHRGTGKLDLECPGDVVQRDGPLEFLCQSSRQAVDHMCSILRPVCAVLLFFDNSPPKSVICHKLNDVHIHPVDCCNAVIIRKMYEKNLTDFSVRFSIYKYLLYPDASVVNDVSYFSPLIFL